MKHLYWAYQRKKGTKGVGQGYGLCGHGPEDVVNLTVDVNQTSCRECLARLGTAPVKEIVTYEQVDQALTAMGTPPIKTKRLPRIR